MKNLANLMRPKILEDFIGQEHILNPSSALFKVFSSGTFPHSFFYGSPGSGKTTLARLIAQKLEKPFLQFNATNFKLEELRQNLKTYQNTLTKPIVFIDEIHRLNRTQQEFLLPIMENQEAIILGASTENPYYTLTAAIRSRSLLFEFLPLSDTNLESILNKTLALYPCTIDEKAKKYLISSSGGDARAMLNLLDIAMEKQNIDIDTLKTLRPISLNDGSSENNTHYNLISALIKSIRGSDENAAIYYLARLICGGENPEFIARRLVILASEDIGNANPNALNLATSTMLAVSKIGYPEARIILSQCVIYLSCSPKSNTAYNAINEAIKSVNKGEILSIPKNIIPKANEYLYPHDYGGWVKQKYLQKPLIFVKHTQKAFEKTLQNWLDKIKGKMNEEN
ncbi:replication-associated recombination protein A [Helicobacter sp. 13S00477-4]|uniref:replication-associated recombination protein A n=1 Tax=Helicobacter sp. 13S00477-4 TaxID=1905759 RepID=UPI000BA5CB71|nr:replication-associated recombination protein A [Helicobacter sp. 13S00477-4]PAF52071.1 recombinase RarA [Helicobacter sp. 13S00477-4]